MDDDNSKENKNLEEEITEKIVNTDIDGENKAEINKIDEFDKVNGKIVKNKIVNEEVNKVTQTNLKNKVEDKPQRRTAEKMQTMVEYRRPSVFMSIALILIGVLIACIIFLILYIYNIKDGEVEIYEEPEEIIEAEIIDETDEDKIELDLSITGEFVQELYAKIPLQTRGYEAYSGQKTTQSDISAENKALFVLRKLDEKEEYEEISDLSYLATILDYNVTSDTLASVITSAKKFEYSAVNEEYKRIFGSNKSMPQIDVGTTLGYVYEYVSQDDSFYGHSYAGGGGLDYDDYRKIYYVEQNEDATEVYIYDYYLAFNSLYNITGEINEYALFSSSDYTSQEDIVVNVTREYNTAAGTYYYNGKILEDLFKDYIDSDGGKYKHTFKLDDAGNYYWYSSEKIN